MSRRAARTDTDHRAFVEALEGHGWIVDQTHQCGNGFPDAVCSKWVKAINGPGGYHIVKRVLRLVEFKGPKGKLTEAQIRFHERHDVTTIRSLEDCENLR